MKTSLFILIQRLLPQHLLSQWVGKLAASRRPWLKNFLIRLALRRFPIDMQPAAEQDPFAYKSFNAFFTRELTIPAAKQFPKLPKLGSPAEGVVSQCGGIRQGALIQAKGRYYSAASLLAFHPWHESFQHGSFATIYLAPHNYHRVHSPVSGKIVEMAYVPGKLFSVNLATADRINSLFSRNERLVFYIETKQGKVALVMVGALLVAGMNNPFVKWSDKQKRILQKKSFTKPIDIKVGDELGYFYFGSTVVMCFEEEQNFVVKENTAVTLGETIIE